MPKVRIRVAFHVESDKTSEFEAAVRRLVEAEAMDSTLEYDYFRGPNPGEYIGFEAFPDAEAHRAHQVEGDKGLLDAMLGLATVTSVEVYGSPTPEHRELIAPFNPTFCETVAVLEEVRGR